MLAAVVSVMRVFPTKRRTDGVRPRTAPDDIFYLVPGREHSVLPRSEINAISPAMRVHQVVSRLRVDRVPVISAGDDVVVRGAVVHLRLRRRHRAGQDAQCWQRDDKCPSDMVHTVSVAAADRSRLEFHKSQGAPAAHPATPSMSAGNRASSDQSRFRSSAFLASNSSVVNTPESRK
jgi:hypothetical protein